MLKAQSFEGLFTLLPILLIAVVSIVLRARAGRRRKQREEAARDADTTRPSGTAHAGQGSRKAEAAPSGPQYRWQREYGAVHRAETAGPAAAPSAPFSPQRPPRPQITIREGYTYPPPLTIDDLKSSSAAVASQQPPLIPRVAVSADGISRTAVSRAPRLPERTSTQDLLERMQARGKTGVPAAKTAAPRRSSVAARLERLPPLKRAVIWAEILGPPGGRE